MHSYRKMHSSSSNVFDVIKQKIKEIKKKNRILYKKYKRSEHFKDSEQNIELKNDILDEAESSAVEYCYKKATELAEYYLKLKKVKKQQKINKKLLLNCRKSNIDNYSMISPKLKFVENRQKFKTFLQTSETKCSVNDSFNTVKKQCMTGKKEKHETGKMKKLKSVDSTIFPISSNNLSDNKDNSVSNECIQFSDSFPKFILASDSLDIDRDGDNSAEDVVYIDRDGENSAEDVVYLQSINCSSVKKNKNISLVELFKTPVTNEIKPTCENKKSNKQHKLHNVEITSNQDLNVFFGTDNALKRTVIDQPVLKNLTSFKNATPKLSKPNMSKKYSGKIKSSKCISSELNVIRKPLEVIIPEFDLTTDETSEEVMEIGITRESVELNLTKKPVAIIPELDLTKESVETIPDLDLMEEPVAVIPELDLTKEPVEVDIPELDLTEEPVAVMSELNLTKVHEEVIIPVLDLTEEPVDFPVPILHQDECLNVFSEKIESFKSQGIVITDGKWSIEETNLLRRNFMDFKSKFGIHNVNLLLGLGRNLPFYKLENNKIRKFLKAKHFYLRLGKDINQKSLRSIYYKARALFNPLRKLKDCTHDDVLAVMWLQKKYGNNWNLIGQRLGICPITCCQIHLYNKKVFVKGKWSKIEKEKLISAIKFVANVSDLNNVNLDGISWTRVSELVSTRNINQCFHEWRNNISKVIKNVSFGKWRKSHSAKLIILLKNNYPVTEECYIPWSKLQKHFKSVTHSEFALREKWYHIKYCAPDELKTDFSELIKFCYKKYSKYFIPENF